MVANCGCSRPMPTVFSEEAARADRPWPKAQHPTAPPAQAPPSARRQRALRFDAPAARPREPLHPEGTRLQRFVIYGRMESRRKTDQPVGWRSGSAGALQAQGRGFKSLTDHHERLRAAGCSTRRPAFSSDASDTLAEAHAPGACSGPSPPPWPGPRPQRHAPLRPRRPRNRHHPKGPKKPEKPYALATACPAR